ncbi:MAG TPA: hypothetical protein VMM54_13765 [Nitrospirota bacterium]|nr:hypothetical protein [Nitrospirota bacterium]
MRKDRRRDFTAVKNQPILTMEIGTADLILFLIGAVLFLTIGSLP